MERECVQRHVTREIQLSTNPLQKQNNAQNRNATTAMLIDGSHSLCTRIALQVSRLLTCYIKYINQNDFFIDFLHRMQ